MHSICVPDLVDSNHSVVRSISGVRRAAFFHWMLLIALGWVVPQVHAAHHHDGHEDVTYRIAPAWSPNAEDKRIRVQVHCATDKEPIAARLLFAIDGEDFVPEAVSAEGIRFESIHVGKRQRLALIMSRGTGAVEIRVPDPSQEITVTAVKGYEYAPSSIDCRLEETATDVTIELEKWTDIEDEGWAAADAHLHYERSHPAHDEDWLAILAADGLDHGFFMMLKGGNVPEVWAQQHAYGSDGEATDGARLIVAGEEYRDPRQGHINLFGMGEVIEPISSGGLGRPVYPYHAPALHDVILRARSTGGIGGPAHGGALAQSSTAAVDCILGAAEFFEIANTHLYKTDVWYRLMNCGFILPPTAGTDLPNFPYRDDWQPFFGETCTYVRVGNDRTFAAWKQAIRRGEVFVSSGPMIRLTINGTGPGESIQLPTEGGQVEVQVELESIRPIETIELVVNGSVIDVEPETSRDADVHRWTISTSLPIDQSCWIAARGTGQVKEALLAGADIRQHAIAHTAAIRVLVGDQPICSSEDAQVLVAELTQHQEFYRTRGEFERSEDRDRMLSLFEQAIDALQLQVED